MPLTEDIPPLTVFFAINGIRKTHKKGFMQKKIERKLPFLKPHPRFDLGFDR